jgi:hypothetical protein
MVIMGELLARDAIRSYGEDSSVLPVMGISIRTNSAGIVRRWDRRGVCLMLCCTENSGQESTASAKSLRALLSLEHGGVEEK